MGGLHCKGDDDAGEEASEIARCRRRIVRGRGREPMIGAGRLDLGLLPECSDPCRQPSAAKNAETGTGARLGTQHRGAQLLVGSVASAGATIRLD